MSLSFESSAQLGSNDAVNIGRERYGLSASAQPLPSERDQNFLLTDESGARFVLKIANPSERREFLEFQHSVLDHLHRNLERARVPRICRTTQDEELCQIQLGDGAHRLVRMLSYLPGQLLAHFKPHSTPLLKSIGSLFGDLDRALFDFSHPEAKRILKWDLQGASWIKDHLDGIQNPAHQALVDYFIDYFEEQIARLIPSLRTSLIHNDGNDYNLLVEQDQLGDAAVTALIDFGDMVHSYTVAEPAVACAYSMLGKHNPLDAARNIIAGYHTAFPLTEVEVEALYGLILLRLCVSVTNSAREKRLKPDDHYQTVSEAPAWALLAKLKEISPSLAHYSFRAACNLPPCPAGVRVVEWLKTNSDQIGPVIEPDLKGPHKIVIDLSADSIDFGELADLLDMEKLTLAVFDRMRQTGAKVAIGRYNEARLVYTSDLFKTTGDTGASSAITSRTIHIGLDLFEEAGSRVFSPLKGTIHSFQNNDAPLDYGPTIIVQHRSADRLVTFFTLYGHLSEESLEGLYPGKPVEKGEEIARVGSYPTNGGWSPHLHFQIIVDLLGREGDFPGVVSPDSRDVWLSICPDPNLILGIPEDAFPTPKTNADDILRTRNKHIGSSLSVSYKRPLHFVRGFMQRLYDSDGRVYLDAVNNVAHVGHCHPRVVKAIQSQVAVLNTNTRYLHENMARYAERLCGLLPDPLRVCFFVCSGSEANDLALRLARAHTKRMGIITVEGAYHGNTGSLIDVSPYKFDGPGGAGAPAYVYKVAMPDTYRGLFKKDERDAGARYALEVQQAAEHAHAVGQPVAAFLCESMLGCGGQIVLPDGYLKDSYRYVRDAGAVCIADEVQVGFGRLGSHFWGFEIQRVIPDIVTLGKPIGNGHPLGAVVTTPEIAASFDAGMEYFNTFGGNPVSCAAGLAVLDVLHEDRLQANAEIAGSHLRAGLSKLMEKHDIVGDVRGAGLFIGIELVLDRHDLSPAAAEASYVAERMRDCGVLISTDGPLHNVLKIKPPMVFSEQNADELVEKLDDVLSESFLNRD